MKKITVYLFALLLTACSIGSQKNVTGFVTIQGHDLVKPNGEKLFIQGTNLGNWLNPEGYMFGFGRTNSAWMIDLMMKEAVGPDATAEFWQPISGVMLRCVHAFRIPVPLIQRSTPNRV